MGGEVGKVESAHYTVSGEMGGVLTILWVVR